MSLIKFLDNILSFGGKKSEEKETVHVGKVKRDPTYKKDYQAWAETERYAELIQSIQTPELFNETILFFDKTGNFLHLPSDIFQSEKEVYYFVDSIKAQLASHKYILFKSDVRYSLEEPKGVERYFLKPPFSSKKPIRQLFGNIMIEVYIEKGDMKMFNTFYSGFDYEKPESWESFLNALSTT